MTGNNIKVDIIKLRPNFYRILYIVPYVLAILFAWLSAVNVVFKLLFVITIIISVVFTFYHSLMYKKIGYFLIDTDKRKIIIHAKNEYNEIEFDNQISIKVHFKEYKHLENFSVHRAFGIGNKIEISVLKKKYVYEFVLKNRNQYIKFMQIMAKVLNSVTNSSYTPISKIK